MLTVKPPRDFEPGTPGLRIQRRNHLAIAPYTIEKNNAFSQMEVLDKSYVMQISIAQKQVRSQYLNLKGIVKGAEPCKCVILLVSRIL